MTHLHLDFFQVREISVVIQNPFLCFLLIILYIYAQHLIFYGDYNAVCECVFLFLRRCSPKIHQEDLQTVSL